jgi:hypothetical protein
MYDSVNGKTWWMEHWRINPEHAAAAMRRFNQVLRDYAAARQLPS